jgi:hypothetical protein
MTMPETLWLTAKKISKVEETECSLLGLSNYLNFYPTREQAREEIGRNRREYSYTTPVKYELRSDLADRIERKGIQFDNWYQLQALPVKLWLNFDYENGDLARYVHDKSKVYYGYAKWFLCQIDSQAFYNETLYNPDMYIQFSEPYLYIRS